MKLFKRPKDDLFNDEAMDAISFRSHTRSLEFKIIMKEILPDGDILETPIVACTVEQLIFMMIYNKSVDGETKSLITMPGQSDPASYSYIQSPHPVFMDIVYRDISHDN